MNRFCETILGLNIHVLVGADWCAECIKLKEYADKINLKRMDIDVDTDPEIADLCRVSKLPTLVVFNQGEKVKEVVGFKAIREEICPPRFDEMNDVEQLLAFMDTRDL
jgi:thioredoxin 1